MKVVAYSVHPREIVHEYIAMNRPDYLVIFSPVRPDTAYIPVRTIWVNYRPRKSTWVNVANAIKYVASVFHTDMVIYPADVYIAPLRDYRYPEDRIGIIRLTQEVYPEVALWIPKALSHTFVAIMKRYSGGIPLGRYILRHLEVKEITPVFVMSRRARALYGTEIDI